jgi:excisionase family DNA binding protein
MAAITSIDSILTTGEAARLAGVAESTIRFWAGRGILPFARTANGTRIFDRNDVERVSVSRRPDGPHTLPAHPGDAA